MRAPGKTITLLRGVVPLQPMSTSMPMTCGGAKSQRASQEGGGGKRPKKSGGAQGKLDLQQFIPRITLPQNEASLRLCCADTLERICDEYEIPALVTIFRTLHAFTVDPEESKTSMIALFFLCLDIDVQLKEMMINAESDSMKRKLTGFFVRLRNEIIPMFLCEEQMEVETFVQTCQEAYLLA